MRNGRIYQVGSMIAIRQGQRIDLLTLGEFAEWREILMPELTDLERFQFAMGRDRPTQRAWERQFCKRLGFIDKIGLRDKICDFSNEDARQYLDSFLQIYLLKHEKAISVDRSYVVFSRDEPMYEIPDEAMTLITITIHKRRTMVDHILNRQGVVDREIKILEPAIDRLVGTGQEFLLKSGTWHLFDADGIKELDDEEANDFIWDRKKDPRYRIVRVSLREDLDEDWEDDEDEDGGQTN